MRGIIVIGGLFGFFDKFKIELSIPNSVVGTWPGGCAQRIYFVILNSYLSED
jgi:hypothetical protein